jgi:hypothetical protein
MLDLLSAQSSDLAISPPAISASRTGGGRDDSVVLIETQVGCRDAVKKRHLAVVQQSTPYSYKTLRLIAHAIVEKHGH